MKIICFHNPEEENGYLSNWYLSEFYIDEIHFTSMEQYMMYKKAVLFHDMEIASKIIQTSDVAEIKRLGRAVSRYDENYWNGVRQIVVYQGLMAKFSQNEKLKNLLLSTGDSILAECAVKDRIWGIGVSMKDADRLDKAKWKGQNLLGYALMLVREKLQAKAWEQRKFGELVEKYEDIVDTPTEGYTRLGIRSHAKGTFHSYVEKGKELETAKMFRVAANNFIVNITFGWEHAVAITDENDAGKLVSHRFPQYSFNEGKLPEFFKYLILDERFRHHLELSSPGGAGRNRVLKLNDMLDYKMSFPRTAEQEKVGMYFSHLDYIITFHQRKHEKYKKHKNDIKNIKLSLIRFCIIKNDAIFIILKIYILFIKAEMVAYKLSLERKIY